MTEKEIEAARDRAALYLRMAAMATIPELAAELRRKAVELSVAASRAEKLAASQYAGWLH